MRILELQTLCVNSIVANFERFYKQCQCDEDSTETCLGLYTDDLVKKYALLTDKAVDAHIEILMNKYLKVFDAKLFHKFDVSILNERITVCGKNFTHLNLSKAIFDVGSPMIEIIAKAASNVETVIMEQCECQDSHLKLLANYLDKLRCLSINGCRNVTSKGLEHFCRSPNGTVLKNRNIHYLDLAYTRTDKSAVYFCFRNFLSLQVLHHHLLGDVLYEMAKSKRQTYNISKLPLKKIWLLEEGDVTSLDVISVCPSLCMNVERFVAYIDDCKLLNPSFKLPLLKYCILRGKRDSHCDIDGFLRVNGAKLVNMGVIEARISLKVIIECCPLLNEITLHYPEIICDATNVTTVLTNLTKITIVALLLDDDATIEAICYILFNSPNLESVEALGSGNFKKKIFLRFLHRNASIENILLKRSPDIITLKLCSVNCSFQFLQAFVITANKLESFEINSMNHILTESELSTVKTLLKKKHSKFLNVKIN